MAVKLTSIGLETVYYNMVAAVKLNSTEPETIPFDQRLGRRIFPPVNLEQSNLRLFKFLASLGLQTSNLGQCGTASSVVLKESPCPVFCSNLAELFVQSAV